MFGRKNFYKNPTLAIILFFTNTSLVAAGFDCNRAETDIEKMICDNSPLNKADEQMSKAYFQLRKVLSKSESQLLKEDQRNWLGERNIELLHCIEPNCELYFYELRIQQLGPVEQASFNCKKAETKVEKKICGSRLLKHADGRVTKLYKPLQKELKQDHYNWLKNLTSSLSKSYCDTECAWQIYKDRIAFLVSYTF
ncbi:lysozyme inhibitor LprI family protein [Candidatus Parabeggiatoa sp. HSG14]|uniref:lysozyme inhibitor LprI family protein n=1 Tax=Candidatus Parabeggiatoa sp. HSG14 TaxID=3055593 RepID=UPI0025A7C87A|nr:lysozyme inhibitor LprI family protein [Thiotrichales bacterium HSG14]